MGVIASSLYLTTTLDADLAALNAAGAKVILFSNNWTPAVGDTISALTEATFSGYSAQTIGAWAASAFSTGKARSTASGNPFTFTNSTGVVNNSIYGYAVVNSAKTVLHFAERGAAAPYDLNGAGKSLAINLKYTRGDDPAPD